MSTTRPFTRSEIKMILKSEDCSIRDRTLISLMCNSGYRVSEILSLKIKNVASTLKGKMKINQAVTVQKDSMKGKRTSRSCRLNSDAKSALNQHVSILLESGGSMDDALFSGRNGAKRLIRKAITRVTAWRIIKKAAICVLGTAQNLANHSCRKVFAQMLMEKTGNILLVSAALYHRQVTTTQAYISSCGAMSVELENLI